MNRGDCRSFDRHCAIGGDVIVLPYGDQHCMGGVHDAETVSMASILPMPPRRELPVIRHGADGERTDLVCGTSVCKCSFPQPLCRGVEGDEYAPLDLSPCCLQRLHTDSACISQRVAVHAC